MAEHPSIIPGMRYRDAKAAIEWLCRAFGFEQHLVVPGERGSVAQAELTYRNGMIMVGSARDDDFGKLQKTPAQLGGVTTKSAYVVVPDAKAHHDSAVAAGAKVVRPLSEGGGGGLSYSCLDLEDHLWNFGTYDPWEPGKR
jgi:uncharacterized glyoxalase superfamily protein PhnB